MSLKLNKFFPLICLILIYGSNEIRLSHALDLTPTYTEVLEPWTANYTANAWTVYNVTNSHGIPQDAVIVVMALPYSYSVTIKAGIREKNSVLDRSFLHSESESVNSMQAIRFVTTVSPDGLIEYWDSTTTILNYSIVGYWDNADFVEQWVTYAPTSAEDAMWHETDGTELGLQINSSHLITMRNDAVAQEYLGGVRNTSSTVNRYTTMCESENGGYTSNSYWVQSDASKKIDVWCGNYLYIDFVNQGYFLNTSMYYQEADFTNIFATSNNRWVPFDMSSAIDQDGRVLDILLRHYYTGQGLQLGAREGGSSFERRWQINEAESGGWSGYGISAKTNGTGFIEIYTESGVYSSPTYSGYFKPYNPIFIPSVYDPSLLFGAGFNWSDPYIHIRWNHSGLVSNYTVQHSTNGIAFSVLVVTPTKYYNHTSLVNGSYHWYKVRADYYYNITPEWINSSFSEINLERVWFPISSGGNGSSPCPPSNETIINEFEGTWKEYNVSSITVTDGTYDVGWLNSTQFVDGNVYRVNESVGVDPLDVRFNFTGIPEDVLSLGIMAYCEYEGNPAHVVVLEVWSFEDSSWELLEVIPEHGFSWHNHSLSFGDYIEDVTGDVWIRYDHQTNGASGHYLTVDYLKLRAFVMIGENVDAWSINWLTSLLWLGVLAIASMTRSGTMTLFAGFFGLILGILMLSTNTMVAISLILLNLYLIYTGSE